MPKNVIYVCTGSHCREDGAKAVLTAFRESLEAHALSGKWRADSCGCLKKCGKGPVALFEPGDVKVKRLTTKKVTQLVEDLGQGILPEKKRKKSAD